MNGLITNYEQAQQLLGSRQAMAALNSTLNKTLTTVRAKSARQISKEYVVKVGDIKKTMTPTRSRFSTLFVELESSGVRLPLGLFSPRKKRDGVSVKIKRGAPRQVLKRHFVATMANGHVGVFTNYRYTRRLVRRVKRTGRRFGKNRSELPIDDSFTIGIPKMWRLNDAEALAANRMIELWPKEMQYRLDKAAAGSKR
ncbi:MAG: hypothetical protein JKY93_02455 [Gammaproteobacteria bacterium]|nr:hypothetical protein [Gammaproteobacteria bacterium]